MAVNFHVGQQVVCVDDDYTNHPAWVVVPNRPVRGSVYTIREVCEVTYETGPDIGLRLIEVVNAPICWRDGVAEHAFHRQRFRPLRKTSIEVFERMLIKAPETVS
jgi:hypothetical protein